MCLVPEPKAASIFSSNYQANDHEVPCSSSTRHTLPWLSSISSPSCQVGSIFTGKCVCVSYWILLCSRCANKEIFGETTWVPVSNMNEFNPRSWAVWQISKWVWVEMIHTQEWMVLYSGFTSTPMFSIYQFIPWFLISAILTKNHLVPNFHLNGSGTTPVSPLWHSKPGEWDVHASRSQLFDGEIPSIDA